MIDEIAPDASYQLFQMTYPYGELITKNGILNVPHKEAFVPYHHHDVESLYAEQFSYSHTPLILQLHNTAEVFFEKLSGIVSLNTLPPGSLYALFEVMQPLAGCCGSPSWHVSSGSRSAFMLPNISDYTHHDKIKKAININCSPPHSIADHGLVFKDIARNTTAATSWFTQILVFGKEWFSKKNDSKAWLNFYNFLYKSSWRQSHALRIYYEFNILWEHIVPLIKCRQPNFYLLATFKNLINLGFGGQPGFKPSLQENSLLPGNLIEDIYVNIYGLKNYLPTIMIPHRLNGDNDFSSIYYSFAQPMLLEGNPNMRNKRNVLAEEEQVFDLVAAFMKEIENKSNTYFYDEIKRITFDFFHPKYEVSGKISSSKNELEDDGFLFPKNSVLYPDRVCALTSSFLQGFVRLSKKGIK